jgi:putative N-acetylmannosamine-6-phosphate epimerase
MGNGDFYPAVCIFVRTSVLTGSLLAATTLTGYTQSFSTNPGTFGAKTCQQLWYVEQQVLAEGRVCLKTERARRAFRRAERCISSNEAILPIKTRNYLAQLRGVGRDKGCSGF